MPCVPGIRSRNSPGGIVFPRESEAEGVDSLYASTPRQTDTGTDCGGSMPSFLLVTLMLSRLTLTFTTDSTLMGLNLTFVRLLRDCNSHGGLIIYRLGWSINCG